MIDNIRQITSGLLRESTAELEAEYQKFRQTTDVDADADRFASDEELDAFIRRTFYSGAVAAMSALMKRVDAAIKRLDGETNANVH